MGGVTKKTKEMPKSLEALKLLVQAHMIEGADKKETVPGFTIEYQDEDRDNIAILDNDDLLLAYEWAQEHSNCDLRLIINPLKKQRKARAPREGKYDPFATEPQEYNKETDKGFKKDNKNKQETASGDEEVEYTTKPWKARRERGDKADKDQWKQRKMMKKIIKQSIKEHTKKVLEGVD